VPFGRFPLGCRKKPSVRLGCASGRGNLQIYESTLPHKGPRIELRRC
jgi:hypothetical protein